VVNKRGLQTSFQEELAAEISRLIGRPCRGGIDFQVTENAAIQSALRLAATALENLLNHDSDDRAPNRTVAAAIHRNGSDRRQKTFQTVLGELTPWRAYYYCAQWEPGFFLITVTRCLGYCR
jgi:hypothetical protein